MALELVFWTWVLIAFLHSAWALSEGYRSGSWRPALRNLGFWTLLASLILAGVYGLAVKILALSIHVSLPGWGMVITCLGVFFAVKFLTKGHQVEVSGEDVKALHSLLERLKEIPTKKELVEGLELPGQGEKGKEIREEVERLIEEISDLPEEIAKETTDRMSERLSGLSDYEAGQDYQLKSVREFESMGFDVDNYPSGGEYPDHVLSYADDIVGAVEVRHKKITKSTTLRRSNFVTGFDYADRCDVPLVLKWWNPETDRLWLCVVEPNELDDDFNLTVPIWLWRPELSRKEKTNMQRDLAKTRRRIRKLAESGENED